MDGGNGPIRIAPRSARPVRIELERLTVNGQVARGEERHLQAGRALRIVVGYGRSCVLQENALPTVLMPLRGRLRTSNGDGVRMLRSGQVMVVEQGQRLQAIGSNSALWLGFVAPASVWRQLFEATREAPVPEPLLFPAVHVAARSLQRQAIRVAREARGHVVRRIDESSVLLEFATLLADLQAGFDTLIKRCPGRTLAQRRNVFLRLQRVYHWMESTSDIDLGVAGFARAANYSPCHFVRTFSTVFGETPHAVLVEHRLRRAFRLVHDTELSITEVARASGFEDRCAFARSFKQRFGRTATAVRRRAAEVA